ncbi:hypothetical protein A0H76_740 [Hepatospora eriocheir]|uniref:B30.2/SPRY domain-containing protein n=1 Tax=Hepatospora eriocheir TaxID=1081669 RepID=A0A1X0QL02_9MICR|nr:hypothetical protein A0H76_740 [Hepatospora eriocheir]
MKRISTTQAMRNMQEAGSFGVLETEDDLIVYSSDCYNYKTCVLTGLSDICYFEAALLNSEGEVRIGFAEENVDLLGPLGTDCHGFALGSKNGYGFSKLKRINFGGRYRKHDIVSCEIIRKDSNKFVKFYINGVHSFKDFEVPNNIVLYPAFSLYGFSNISLNFGPYYAYKDLIERRANAENNN